MIFKLIMSALLVLFASTSLHSGHLPSNLKTDLEVMIEATRLDAIMQMEERTENLISDAIQLDNAIEAEAPITINELRVYETLELYQMDKELVKRKLDAMNHGELRDELKNALTYFANVYGIEPNLAKAVAKAESNYNPYAKSNKDAFGVMQLIKATAEDHGVEDVFNAIENIEGGVLYLSKLLKKYNGNKALALAAYNAGPGNVKKHRGIPPFKETKNYVKKVLKYYQIYEKTEPC